MTQARRRALRHSSIVGAATAAVALAGAAPALARTPAKSRKHFDAAPSTQAAALQTANASFSAGPLQADFTAARAAGATETQATGHFHAIMKLGQTGSQLMSLDGPVTCLSVVGNTVGLFYPVNISNPAAFGEVMKGVYVYASTNSAGKPMSMSFVPSTSATATSCDPLPTFIPITAGYVSLTS